jgi:hypothetical protein
VAVALVALKVKVVSPKRDEGVPVILPVLALNCSPVWVKVLNGVNAKEVGAEVAPPRFVTEKLAL